MKGKQGTCAVNATDRHAKNKSCINWQPVVPSSAQTRKKKAKRQ